MTVRTRRSQRATPKASCLRRSLLAAAALAGLVGACADAPQPGRTARVPDTVFDDCRLCHSLEPGRHGLGPSLAGVFGRKAGTAEGYAGYSARLKRSEVVWTEATLKQWLSNPLDRHVTTRSEVPPPGAYMAFFTAWPDAERRDRIVAYLKQETRSAE